MEAFDFSAKAKETANELFYKTGAAPEAILPSEAQYAYEIIGQAMMAAYNAGFAAALQRSATAPGE